MICHSYLLYIHTYIHTHTSIHYNVIYVYTHCKYIYSPIVWYMFPYTRMYALITYDMYTPTRVYVQSSTGGQYSGVADAFSSIYKEGGIKSLYIGSYARVAWLLPFTTIYLGVYEFTKRALLKRKIDLYLSKRVGFKPYTIRT